MKICETSVDQPSTAHDVTPAAPPSPVFACLTKPHRRTGQRQVCCPNFAHRGTFDLEQDQASIGLCSQCTRKLPPSLRSGWEGGRRVYGQTAFQGDFCQRLLSLGSQHAGIAVTASCNLQKRELDDPEVSSAVAGGLAGVSLPDARVACALRT